MPQSGGAILHVIRKVVQHHGAKTRTYGTYELTVGGVPTLSGFVCEPHGPDDNDHENCGRRIEPGRYDLCTHFGAYRTIGYNAERKEPLPCLAVGNMGTVGKRTFVLVHPAHMWNLGPYLSSIGCLNLTGPLEPDESMDTADSFARVVAVINAIKARSPAAFKQQHEQVIPEACIVIENAIEGTGDA